MMFETEIRKKVAAARAEGRRFLLVCADTMDRIKMDEDLGYYYLARDTMREVISALEEKQLGPWTASDLRDHCEAVLDLSGQGEPAVHDPADWLARHARPEG